MRVLGRVLLLLLVLGGLGFLGRKVWTRFHEDAPEVERSRTAAPAPVEVAPIRTGAIELKRTISGTLETPSEITVAPKIAGAIEHLAVDLSDTVTRGDVVCRLDDDEHQQAVQQAEAEVTVAQANRTEAEKALEIALRGLARIETLRERGVASEVQHDGAIAEKLAKEAALAVATAQVTRAESNRKAATIRLGYTVVTATWTEGSDTRIVAERFVDEGQTVAANAPLLLIVELDPLLAVIYVTEQDYAKLSPGLVGTLTTDAFPGETFEGTITRISPVLRQSTRQARVELRVANPDDRLRPGMFIRLTLVLDTAEEATIVPVSALAKRGDADGIFVLDADGEHVRWRTVTPGIRQGGDVEIRGEGLVGRVVTLGQQLVDDGSAVHIPEPATPPGSPAEGGEAVDGGAPVEAPPSPPGPVER